MPARGRESPRVPNALRATPRRRARLSPRCRLPRESVGNVRRYRDSQSARDHAIDADDRALERRERPARIAWREPDVSLHPALVAVRRGMDDTEAQRSTDAE